MALLFIILPYSFPKLLDGVIPLSLEHFPFVPIPLYIVVMLPSCHSIGIFFCLGYCIDCFSQYFSGFFIGFYEYFVWYIVGSCAFSSLVSLWHCWFLFHRWLVVVPLFLGIFLFPWLCVWCGLSNSHIPGCLLWLGTVVAHYVIFCFLWVYDFSTVFCYLVIGVGLLLVFSLFLSFKKFTDLAPPSLLSFSIFILAACLFDFSMSFLGGSWLMVYFSLCFFPGLLAVAF